MLFPKGHAAPISNVVMPALLMLMLSEGCRQAPAAPDHNPAPLCLSDSMARIIAIDSAGIERVSDQLNLSGEVAFSDKKVVRVYPFSSGQVLQVNVSLGDKVQKGQVLAVIRSADVAGDYADLAGAANDVELARRQMTHAQSMYQQGLGSERDYQDARENYAKMLENHQKIQDQLNINGGGKTRANGEYRLTAPISGYVVEKKISQGSFIRSDNGDNLFTIGDIGEVWIWANVYETDINRVKEGYPARITTLAYPSKIFKGTVDKANQILDPETRVMKIRIRLPNPDLLLKPEMFANIMIDNQESKSSVTIPAAAVISDNGKKFVVVYHDSCHLENREIEVLKSVGDKTYVSHGLRAGEKVISRNQVLLYNALLEQ